MKYTKFAILAALTLGIAAPAQAQVPVFDSAAVGAGCAAAGCAAAAQAALNQLTASGLTGKAYSDQIALLASLLYTLAQNGQAPLVEVSAALRTVAAGSTNAAQQAAILGAAANVEAGRIGTEPAPAFEASPN